MASENRTIRIGGKEYMYIHSDKTANFEKDLFTVADILNKDIDTITPAERIKLLTIYKPSFHKSGKIEDIMSFDSTATNCEFCQLMRKAAENNKMHICNYCYDYKQEHSFKGVNVLNRHTLNMIIMSTVEFTVEELKILNVAYINRVNSSGDVPNLTYARNMIKLCFAFGMVKFAFWAKNTEAVKKACKELGKPENVVLIQSSQIIGKPAKLEEYFDFVFTVYATKAETESAILNGAGACNGKKCKECKFKCYTGEWKENGVKNIAEYLRIPGVHDDKREALLK